MIAPRQESGFSNRSKTTDFQNMCLQGIARSALCEAGILPDSRTGLKHQIDTGLKCPAAFPECSVRASFHTSLWPKRSDGRGRITAKPKTFCDSFHADRRKPQSGVVSRPLRSN
jgi:hypothetical protein